mmetsp:Transcript_10779/g.11771  ORF Transcript_10779/g.11771 Transcript_10779/m.11771 type:complete len:227 (-) Transcript_10779:239-919(-)
MLVLSPGQVVNTIDISPPEVSGQTGGINVLMRSGSQNLLSVLIFHSQNATLLRLSLSDLLIRAEEIFHRDRKGQTERGLSTVEGQEVVVVGQGEGFLDFLSDILGRRDFADLVEFSVGNSPGARFLDTQVVNTSDDSEVSLFTPPGSPGVSDSPELDTIFFSPSDDGNDMVDGFSSGLIPQDSSLVVIQFFVGINTASNRATVEDFTHHSVFTGNLTELGNFVLIE